jgi:hypothetical protein
VLVTVQPCIEPSDGPRANVVRGVERHRGVRSAGQNDEHGSTGARMLEAAAVSEGYLRIGVPVNQQRRGRTHDAAHGGAGARTIFLTS